MNAIRTPDIKSAYTYRRASRGKVKFLYCYNIGNSITERFIRPLAAERKARFLIGCAWRISQTPITRYCQLAYERFVCIGIFQEILP